MSGNGTASPRLSTLQTEDKITVVRELVEFSKILSDEVRGQILVVLDGAEDPGMNVKFLRNTINVQFNGGEDELSQPGLSHHLAIMKKAGILLVTREGKHNFYRINRKMDDSRKDVVVALGNTFQPLQAEEQQEESPSTEETSPEV